MPFFGLCGLQDLKLTGIFIDVIISADTRLEETPTHFFDDLQRRPVGFQFLISYHNDFNIIVSVFHRLDSSKLISQAVRTQDLHMNVVLCQR